jgi:GWxTD domain-containing protein
MVWREFLIPTWCFIVSFQSLFAQGLHPPRRDEVPLNAPRLLYYQALNVRSNSPSLSRIDIIYRVDLSFFVAVRNSDLTSIDPFQRQGEILVELIDSAGHSRARDIKHIEVGSPTSETTTDVRTWFQGMMTFDVEPGRYSIVFDVEDRESDRHLFENKVSVRAKDFSTGKTVIGDPFLASTLSVPGNPVKITPHNLGGGIGLGERGTCVLPLANLNIQQPLHVEYTVASRSGDPDQSIPALSDTVEKVELLQGVSLTPADSTIPTYDLVSSKHDEAIAIIPLAVETLPLQQYTLSVHVSGGDIDQTVSMTFETLWPGMPRSLRDLDYALASLRYLVSPGYLDSLSRGTESETRTKFEEFWKTKDTTPGTAYNEVMAEYYARVDYAATTFATLRQSDGSRTDRGRIHILFGPPTTIRRKLDPSGFIEEWSYDSLGKRFIFLDASKTGNYVLSSAQSL